MSEADAIIRDLYSSIEALRAERDRLRRALEMILRGAAHHHHELFVTSTECDLCISIQDARALGLLS